MNSEILTKFTQENLVCLLAFDIENCLLVRNAITPELFDGIYKKIVTKLISYIDKYKVPPQEHIADELESYLASNDGEKYREVLTSIYSFKANYNAKYIIDQLLAFIKNRNFEIALYDAAGLHTKGKTTEAQEVLRKSFDVNLTMFDPGIRITDLNILAKSLEENDIFSTGVQALDDMGVGPARGQLFVLLAPPSKGKSMLAIQLGKMAMLTGLKVVHVSLEISKELVLQRYIQTLCGITRWQYSSLKAPMFVRDGNHEILRVDQAIINPRSLEEANILEFVKQKLQKFGPKVEQNVRIKDFPSGTLTFPMLRAYLDGLERTENFIPDLLVLDHATNMHLPIADFRLQLGRLFIDLRGLAAERNMAISTAHQINRAGLVAKSTGLEHISEDFSVAMTADTGIIYSQKAMEAKMGLARLFVARARSQRSLFNILITQHYASCTFATDSALLPDSYNPEESMGNLTTVLEDE